jgi:hypothetical protein
MANNKDKEYSMKTDETFQKGQYVLYKGEEAKILGVKPLVTIKIENKNQIICGDVVLKDIFLK